jgi:hypothetical protein
VSCAVFRAPLQCVLLISDNVETFFSIIQCLDRIFADMTAQSIIIDLQSIQNDSPDVDVRYNRSCARLQTMGNQLVLLVLWV